MRENPRQLQVYKHFKGTYYQVLTVAKHSETGEMLVIYKALFGSDEVYARPLDMFMSEVDHEKYPEVKQKWRFALATGQNKGAKSPAAEADLTSDSKEEPAKETAVEEPAEEETMEEEAVEAEKESMEETEERAEDDDFLDRFLDADTYEEKLDVFTDMWKTINEDNIDNVAVIMDLNLTGETLEEKYKEILSHLKMRARYESSRLR